MIYMIVIPADLYRLATFFKHLFEMIREAYPAVDTAEFPFPNMGRKDV